jgi:pimeloyl-ACP methyl ester carboxylesterase
MRIILLGGLMMVFSTFLYAGPPPLPDGWSGNYVYANGIRIHYYHATPAPDKPVIVMVHGVTDIGLNWTPLTRGLEGDFDIYMLDTRAHGLSDPFTPTDDGDTLVKDVVSFVETMGFERPILMGHSMGGATVMRLGAEYPDLAQAIVIVDAGVGRRPPSSPSAGERPEPVAPPSPAQDNLSVNMRGSPEALVAQNNYSFDDLVATSQSRHPKWSLESHQYWALSKKQYHGPYTEAAWQAMSGTMRTGDSLENIPVPTLILKADASPEQRAVHEEVVSMMPNGRIVHIDGGGHNLHHDEPKRTLEVLNEFLSTLSR